MLLINMRRFQTLSPKYEILQWCFANLFWIQILTLRCNLQQVHCTHKYVLRLKLNRNEDYRKLEGSQLQKNGKELKKIKTWFDFTSMFPLVEKRKKSRHLKLHAYIAISNYVYKSKSKEKDWYPYLLIAHQQRKTT